MRRRLLLSMVLVTAAALAIFAVPLGIAVGSLHRTNAVSGLERDATRALGAVPASGFHGGEAIELPQPKQGEEIGLYDETGTLVAGRGAPIGDDEVKAALIGEVGHEHNAGLLEVAIPIQQGTRIIGVVRAAMPWRIVSERTRNSLLAMLGFAAIAIALAAALARRESVRLVAPVAEMSHLAARLGDGDFSARVEPSGIEELDRMGSALNQTAERLGRLLERERTFTSAVSHQLTTPLTSLQLRLEGALSVRRSNTTNIREARQDAERLQATITTLLAVARDSESDVDARADVEEVCLDVATRAREELRNSGRSLVVKLESDLPASRCPAGVLREILSVLVDNATRHGAGTVTLAARPAGRGVVIDVGDEGEGVAGDASAIFDQSRSDRSGTAGHGIGLSLARSLAEAHGARLQLTTVRPCPVFTIALAGSAAE